ncbi:Alkaline phosphatase-like alpha/beta/alpha [Penicillium argentinense]|uniref:Alkaline phosphatase-like alpha/beta/alpha n=1 Tax=Penicillium argentinense TaxID=1131581 RepID=A0A9W9EZA1_9EURO|nr:Alkaline phosphatase-like alpha/beta/alpha [Penicillium argentinense]KAJ5090769.1 Alkaline phosphatase-like alpha/beta/alpha [Penicillium argentinense]
MSLLAFLPAFAPFAFSTLVVSGLASKALHIGIHIHSLPFLYLVIYSPTLVLPEILIITCARLLLQWPAPETKLQWLSTCVGGILGLLTWGASAIQFGFFIQTGAEVAWNASNSFLSDPAAMKILLSGISTVFAAAAVLGIAAWLLNTQVYNLTGLGLQAIQDLLLSGYNFCRGGYQTRYTLLSAPSKSWINSVDIRSARRAAFVVAACFSLLFLELVRPAIPYDHLSAALPLSLLDAFNKKSSTLGGCRNPATTFPLWTDVDPVPLDEGWSRPSWLPQNPPGGFRRWDVHPDQRAESDNPSWYLCGGGDDGGFYNPKADPLKISNLDRGIYDPLKKAFEQHAVSIDHVILVTLESGRKDMFPMQQGSPLFHSLLDSHPDEDRDEATDRLVEMTPVAQMLTGEYVKNSKGKPVDLRNATWHDTAQKNMGGLNVRGAVTGSSLTFKSILGSHCGVNSLPVDMLEESLLEIYQPCLPQLFEAFNQAKKPQVEPSEEHIVEKRSLAPNQSESLKYPWKSVFMQSITDDYDRQDIMNEHMGFRHKVVKSTLQDHESKYRAEGEEINYFGYAETELKPYIRDLFEEAAINKTRLFLSHVTSTTHHPWETPEDFAMEHYMGNQGNINHGLMNNYLNAARFVDNWLGDIMTMLDEAGIANNTLVVFVGDHGQAFGEDNRDLTGTYNNPHISNFRVPLVFRHPHMPRININANATSLSIIPTILDMLIQSHSLDERDSEIASAVLPEYQGQSLIRPFLPFINETSGSKNTTERDLTPLGPEYEHPHFKSVWNFGVINSGGAIMSVMAANIPYRLILPIQEDFEYTFTHLGDDPAELNPIKAWTLSDLVDLVETKLGDEPAAWLKDAEKVGRWYVNDQRRIWGYREA